MPERLECEVLQKARFMNTLTFTFTFTGTSIRRRRDFDSTTTHIRRKCSRDTIRLRHESTALRPPCEVDAISIRRSFISFYLLITEQWAGQTILYYTSIWKLGSIDSLLNRSHKTGTIVSQPDSGRQRLSRSSEGPMCSIRRTSQKGIGQLVRLRMKLPFSV